MKLEINIADQSEIAAAIVLLQKIVAQPMSDEVADAKITIKPAAVKPEVIAAPPAEVDAEKDNAQLELPFDVEEIEYTLEGVRSKLAEFTATYGTAAALDILGKFEATRLSGLDKKKYSAFVHQLATYEE